MCKYDFERNLFSYIHGTTSDGTPYTTARGGQSCSQDAQANSYYLLLLIRVITNYCACVGMVGVHIVH